MNRKSVLILICTLSLMAGCEIFTGSTQSGNRLPTVSHTPAANAAASSALPVKAGGGSQRVVASTSGSSAQETCPAPVGWTLYQMRLNETIYSVALRANVGAADLLRANCQTNPAAFSAGVWLYAPPEAANTAADTLLPLSISALVVDPQEAAAGDMITLAWKAQGPVVRVRAGWLYGGQFIEQASGLPAVGVWQAPVPADGRSAITYEIRVSDGLHEVAAQTAVRVRCSDRWFFNPAPGECPTPSLVTTFVEQRFERGIVVYVPALGVHYVLIGGQAGRLVPDTYQPGMPLAALPAGTAIPAGYHQPDGPIGAMWLAVDDGTRAGLGYAAGDALRYVGFMQRAPGDTVYFSAGVGGVYRLVEGSAWQFLAVQ